jgi:glycosyltransferase involved in cell wall biosynthesis
MPWKGVDDSINALALLGDRVGDYVLDVIGEGPEKNRLVGLCKKRQLDNRVRFLPQIPYGEPFFRYIRRNHVVLVPTRGLEDARIVYDAAASGCVILHSKTPTLQNSAGKLPKTETLAPSPGI